MVQSAFMVEAPIAMDFTHYGYNEFWEISITFLWEVSVLIDIWGKNRELLATSPHQDMCIYSKKQQREIEIASQVHELSASWK